jgi:hypothetical protein
MDQGSQLMQYISKVSQQDKRKSSNKYPYPANNNTSKETYNDTNTSVSINCEPPPITRQYGMIRQ